MTAARRAWTRDPNTTRNTLSDSRYSQRFNARLASLQARYDVAQTTTDNSTWWAAADGLDANQSNSAATRKTIRDRARYEVANNCYASGIVGTLVGDIIGPNGPRMQVLLEDQELAREIEARNYEWKENVHFVRELKTDCHAKKVDGEGFMVYFQREDARGFPVQLGVRTVETDQFTTPDAYGTTGRVDGMILNADGEPEAYTLLKSHPGGGAYVKYPTEYDILPASLVSHWYRKTRPGQYRATSELTAALPLFGHLRRYTLAVIAAAETAAEFAGVLYTDAPADGPDVVDPMDIVSLERRMLLTLPGGWKMGQVDAKQPTTTFDMFRQQILNEIGRCVQMPYIVAALNAENYNYASGRLDYQVYGRAVALEQAECEHTVLRKADALWWQEARLAYPELNGAPRDLPIAYIWPGREHVDPDKEARARERDLKNGATNIPNEYARTGKDWQEEYRKGAESLGVTFDEYQTMVRNAIFPLTDQQQNTGE
jgi:capsid protein